MASGDVTVQITLEPQEPCRRRAVVSFGCCDPFAGTDSGRASRWCFGLVRAWRNCLPVGHVVACAHGIERHFVVCGDAVAYRVGPGSCSGIRLIASRPLPCPVWTRVHCHRVACRESILERFVKRVGLVGGGVVAMLLVIWLVHIQPSYGL